jgi:hypothetical protein
LKEIEAKPEYQQSSQLPAMQAALQRYEMIGTMAPMKRLHAHLVSREGPGKAALLPHIVSLEGKDVVLIVVALSAPASVDVATKMAELLKPASGNSSVGIYAVTSYGANGGDERNPVAGMTQALHGLAEALPANMPLYLLDDANLQAFEVDRAPMAIALDAEGRVRFVAPLATEGDERVLRDAVLPRKPEPIVVGVDSEVEPANQE